MPAAAWTGTLLMSSPPMSLVPPGNNAARTICPASTGRADDPLQLPGITGPHPRTANLAGVAALADHLDLFGGLWIANRGCQRAGFPSAAALMTA